MKKIINCTPHDVNIIDDNGNIIMTFKPEPKPARCKCIDVSVDVEGIGVPIANKGKRFVRVLVDLPEPKPNVFYIVSEITAKAAIDRCDLLTPYHVVKDRNGNKIGCKSLGFVW